MTLLSDYLFATDPFIAERITSAVNRIAVDALQDGRPDTSGDDPATRMSALTRHAYAVRALGAPPETTRAQWAVATSDAPECVDVRNAYAETLGADDVTDDALVNALRAVWDALAGA